MKILGENIDLREVLGEQGGRVAVFGGSTLGMALLHPMVKKGINAPAVTGIIGANTAKTIADYGLPAVEILTGLVTASVGKTEVVRMAGWGVATVGIINGAVTVAPRLKESLKTGFGLGRLNHSALMYPALSAISPSAMATASFEPYREYPEEQTVDQYEDAADSLSDLLFESNRQDELLLSEDSDELSEMLEPTDSGL